MSTLHRSWQYSQYHSLLLLFTSCILQIVLVFWILDDCVTGGRCLWSLLPLNGWVGLNQLSVNRFCWEVNRVLCDWSRVVRCYSFHSPSPSSSSGNQHLADIPHTITHRGSIIFSYHFLVVDNLEESWGKTE